jgi:hypothetical protein
MKSRAIRRHHYERLKKSRKFYWGRIWKSSRYAMNPLTNRQLGVVANTPKVTSCCECCGNPRKVFKQLTLKEIQFYRQKLCD